MQSVKSFILLLYLLSYSFGFSQNQIIVSGMIKDAKGNPVPQAMVAIENTARGSLTDNEGRYSFQTPGGKQTIVVSFFGYNTVRKEINVSRSAVFDFTLEENSVSLEAVQILGKSHNDQIRQKSFSATNIDIQPIAATLNNLNTLVNRSSGIRIREEGGVGSDFNLSINGLSGNAVRYFIDGVPLSALGSGVSLANLPVNLVERIEIYKGVVPAELGEDALGGAINIITRRNTDSYLDASVGTGSFHTYKADFNAQYVHPKTGFTLRPSFGLNYSKNNYTMRDVDVWDEAAREYRPMDMKRFHDGYKSGLARLEAGFTNRTWADEAFVGVAVSAENKELQTGQKQSIVIGNATREKQSVNISARYAKRNFLTKNLSARLYFSYTADHTLVTDTAYRIYAWDKTWAATSFSEVSGRGRSIRHYNRPQTIGRANFNYTVNEANSLNLNYSLNTTGNKRYDDFDQQFIPTNDRLDKHIIGLSYNLRLWDDRWNNTFFVKDYIFRSELKQQDLYWITGINDIVPSATKNHVGYGIGSRFTVLPALSVKASYERSVRLPVSMEFLGNGQTIYPNFRLKPETAHNLNLGAFGEWMPQNKHAVRYEGNFFVRRVTDYILRTTVSDRQSQYNNVGAATVNGVEGEVSYEYNSTFRAAINGTYIEERNKTRYLTNGSPDVTFNNRMPNRPWIYANAELGWNVKEPFGIKNNRLKVDYVFRYIHWFYLTWEAYGTKSSKEIIPTQFANDAAITWSFADDKYSFSVECSNMFDRKLYDNYMLQKPGRAFFGKFRIFIN